MSRIPWFKVDDGLPTSRKLLSIPRRMRLPALGLWTIAGAWSAGELTDGHVPSYMLEEWGATVAQAECLVHAGLWYAERNGYVFHDWHDYQPERSKVLEERENAKIRMKRVREARRSGEHGANVQANADGTSGEVRLTPTRPDPTRPNKAPKGASAASRRKPLTRLPDDWTPKPSHVAYALERGVDGRHEEGQFRAHAAANDRMQRDWDAAFRSWLGNARPSKLSPTSRAQRTVMLATDLLEIEQ